MSTTEVRTGQANSAASATDAQMRQPSRNRDRDATQRKPTRVDTSTTRTTPSLPDARTVHLFLIRGLVAIVWAVVFAAVSQSLTTGVTVGAGVLLVLYPLIDVVASLVDARGQHGSARRLLLANAAVGAVAAAALGVAATRTVADVLTVFGVWAALAGAAQLVVALRRRAQLGKQWPMRLAGGVSVIFGVAFFIAAAGANPMLMMIVVYAASGGVDFVVQAWLIARRRRRLATAGPIPTRSAAAR